MGDVTLILSKIESGDAAAEDLLPIVYDELRRLATAKLAREKPGQTLQATALVHEAYVRLVDAKRVQHWDSQGHLFAAAAEAMRRILVDKAREKVRQKRPGGRRRVQLDSNMTQEVDLGALLDLDEALSALESHDAEAAKLVKLRYFAGFTHKDAAEVMGISKRAADRLWILARTWLYRQISDV